MCADEHTLLTAARRYHQRGYSPVPVPAGQKGPVLLGWNERALTEAELPQHFNGGGNIGLLTGKFSRDRVDVDIDALDALEIADQYLPPTPAETGRPSKKRSHRWYVSAGTTNRQFKDPVSKTMIVELRGTALQTLVGPSIHPSGEPYDMLTDEPASVPAPLLEMCVESLAKEIIRRRHPDLKDTGGGGAAGESFSGPATHDRQRVDDQHVLRRAAAYLDAMPASISGQGGHDAAYAAATAMVHGFCLHPDQALQLLLERFNSRCEPLWSEKEMRHKVEDAATKSHDRQYGWLRDAAPETNDAPKAAPENPQPEVTVEGATPESGAGAVNARGGVKIYPCTDLGNAERFAARYPDRLRYCHETGKWLVWDQTRWREDNTGEPVRLAGEVARDILLEARACRSKKKREALADWAIESESRARLEAMVALARPQRDLVVRVEQLDTDPWLFNVLDGTIDLRTGEMREHRRGDYITRVAPVQYDTDARCPLFLGFLDRIFASDAELIGFVLRLLGMSLTGDITEQVLPIFHGKGANGKSVLIDTVRGLMGEYATIAPPSLLTVTKHREHATEIADLRGRRLVVASETEEGAVLKLQFVKQLTGDEALKGRFMRQDFFEFRRTHKTVMITNNKPRVSEDSEAVWRRLRLVPFGVVIPRAERDPLLLDKLRPEWSAILAMLVQGCVAWRRDGLGEPPAVAQATADYRAAEDALGRFIEELCEVDDVADRSKSELFISWRALLPAYAMWSERSGETAMDGRELGEALDKRGFPSVTKRLSGQKPAKGRAGLRLRT